MGCGGTCRNAWFVVRGSMLLRKRKGLIRVRNPSSRGSEQGKVPPQAVTSLPRELRRDSAPVTKFPEREGACADRRQARYARAVVRSVRTDGEAVRGRKAGSVSRGVVRRSRSSFGGFVRINVGNAKVLTLSAFWKGWLKC